jgi:hypothetical protein
MNKFERVHTGEQIRFPHLAKNGRDMGHPQLRLRKSFKTCSVCYPTFYLFIAKHRQWIHARGSKRGD